MPGWPKSSKMPVKRMVLTILILVVAPVAALCQDQPPTSSAIVYDDDASMPSMELLEFLGEWETEDGEWIDPILLDAMLVSEQESSDE